MAKLISMFLVAFVAIQLCCRQTATAQVKVEVKELKAAKAEKTRGENPNIKIAAPTTDTVTEKQKGDCCIKFDNWTGYYIDVYVDGCFQGAIGPWGSSWVYHYSFSTIYCITRGGTYEWAHSGTCEENFVYKLSI